MLITSDQFSKLVPVVIDNFEGGYYNPSMLSHFKPSDQTILKDSGETMYGLDRMAGGELAKYQTWKPFWDAIDGAKAANPAAWGWPKGYQYKGGNDAPKLKDLASQVMFSWFSELAAKYLNQDSTAAIANDDRLLIHFSYACWNGEGWFKRFAQALTDALKNSGDKEAIFQSAIKARTESANKTIRQQGAHMMTLFKTMHLI